MKLDLKNFFDINIHNNQNRYYTPNDYIFIFEKTLLDKNVRLMINLNSSSPTIGVNIFIDEVWIKLGTQEFWNCGSLTIDVAQKFMFLFEKPLISLINNYKFIKDLKIEKELYLSGIPFPCYVLSYGWGRNNTLSMSTQKCRYYYDDRIGEFELNDELPIQSKKLKNSEYSMMEDVESLLDGKIIFNSTYPRLGRGELCATYSGTDINISSLKSGQILHLKTSRGTSKEFKVLHITSEDRTPRAIIIEKKLLKKADESKNLRYLIDVCEIEDAYDALFDCNRAEVRGWRNKCLYSER